MQLVGHQVESLPYMRVDYKDFSLIEIFIQNPITVRLLLSY